MKVVKVIARVFLISVFVLTGEVAFANPAHEILSGLSYEKRNVAFTEFMRKNGEDCEVIKSFFQGFDNERNAYWNVACKRRGAWVIQVMPNKTGSTRIMPCSIQKSLTRTECFKTFE